MKRNKLVLTVLAALSVTALLVGGCGSTEQKSNGSSSSDNKDKKVLRVGSETTFPPFEFVEDGKYVGFDVEYADALAKEMGYDKMEFVSMGFDALVPALQSKQIDMVAAALVITPERKEKVLFSEPYYHSGLVMVVRKDDDSIQSDADLANKTIGAQVGTTGAFYGKEKPGTTVKEMDTINQLFLELQNKGIDVIIIDKPTATYFVKQGSGKDFKITGNMVKANDIALAVNKDDAALQQKLNEAMKKLKDNGTYDKLYNKWLSDVQQ